MEQEQFLISAGADKGADPDDDREIHHGDEHSEQAVDHVRLISRSMSYSR